MIRDLPPQLLEKVHRFFGDEGRAWLPRLPDILDRCREKWGLRTGEMCPDMSINYIEFTHTSEGMPVALKVGVPHSEMFTEMEALRLYDGHCATRFLDADRELGAILMQRVQPGTMLWKLGDNARETRIAAEVMRDLSVPVPKTHGLPTFRRWIERAFRLTRTEWDLEERMPRDLLNRAEAAFEEIDRTKSGDVVLHGDLHHENILLDDERGWIAIDPKGVVGAPCLEVGRFLQNQIPSDFPMAQREKMLQDRVRILSDTLGYAPEVVAAGGLVDYVLSHCWSLEDAYLQDDWFKSFDTARALCGMM